MQVTFASRCLIRELQDRPLLEADSFSANEDILRILWKSNLVVVFSDTCLVCVCSVVRETESVREQGAEEAVWTQGTGRNRRLTNFVICAAYRVALGLL